jgi:prepilin-type N-terminal cleavage/methylation domain-containing protein
MTLAAAAGNNAEGIRKAESQSGFSLIETLIAVVILSGAFAALLAAMPMSALLHRAALERQTSLSLAQYQMEYFLTNPGPYPGDTGTQSNFMNAAQFPTGYSGSYAASSFTEGSGLTVIVISVTPPHGPKVEISGIDTTYSNIWH